MKCLGAVDSFVVRLFLLESAMLGGVGAVIGGVAGFLILFLVNVLKRRWGDFVGMDWGYMGTHFVYALGVGIAISVRAAKLPPAAALRTDV